MNIIVLHGDDIRRSYQRFKELSKKAKEDGWEIENSLDNLRSASLFTKKRLFLIYYDKTLPQNFFKKFPKETKIEEFKLPKIIFNFLDSFYPKNEKRALQLFHEVIKYEPTEFVFALLARHVRDLYWVKVDGRTLSYPSWRMAKLRRQSSNLTVEQLKALISKFAEIDIDAKTSHADLVSSLDLLIATKLQ